MRGGRLVMLRSRRNPTTDNDNDNDTNTNIKCNRRWLRRIEKQSRWLPRWRLAAQKLPKKTDAVYCRAANFASVHCCCSF